MKKRSARKGKKTTSRTRRDAQLTEFEKRDLGDDIRTSRSAVVLRGPSRPRRQPRDGAAMKVLLLGAGASVGSGYPVTAQLMAELRVEAEQRDLPFRDNWQRWEAFRTGAPEPLSTLLNCPNPEVVLSVPDLFEVADDAITMDSFRRLRAAWGTPEEETQHRRHEQLYESGKLSALFEGARARNLLLNCLYRYFAYKHCVDSQQPDRREYLRRLFRSLEPGDVIVTLNWDTTAERSLGELEMWNPMTGYGFKKELTVRAPGAHETHPWPTSVSPLSPVLVLKIHGSFGWHRGRAGAYFDHPYFLDHLDFSYRGEKFQFRDPLHRPLGPPDDPLMVYPSFPEKTWRNGAPGNLDRRG